MLDLETFGTKPGSAIVSIGAVKFGFGEILDRFYARVDPASCVAAGLKIDPGTVLWWLKQNEVARLEITNPGKSINEVLNRFASWLGDRSAEIWGDGAAFDNVLLAAAYDATGITRPWMYWNDRCYRTVKNLFPVSSNQHRTGTLHNALDDAESQALHLMAILK